MISVMLSQDQIYKIARGVYFTLTDSIVSEPPEKNISEVNSSQESETTNHENNKSNLNS